MRILLFGATGYIGGQAARLLAAKGHAVTVVVRREASAAAFRADGMEALVGDARNMAFTPEFFAPYDGVLWAAQLMLEEEEAFCAAALRALAKSGKAFIFTSGTSLVSQPTNGEWSEDTFSEYDDFLPRRQVAPRRAIETMVRVAAHYGVRAMVVRPPLIWGHGGCRIIEDLYHSARKTGAVCYVGSGLNLYTHVHVDDLSELYALALEKGVAGALYHLASGEVAFRTMAETIARHLSVGTRSLTIAEAAEVWDPFMGPIVFSGCSRTRAPRSRLELGWRPSADKCDLLVECVAPGYAEATERAPPSWVRKG
ncbi:MAG: NAD-dependent epimerase/dehydratase family protein [Sphingomonadales bacterium]|nr:NAD-dependent epimerase/dehydratase family protein [Sphingomonadales bacterium]